MILKLTNRARKDIQKLPKKTQLQLGGAIRELSQPPYRGIRLSGPWEGYRRIRSGEHRIIYRIEESEIIIHYVRARKESYRKN